MIDIEKYELAIIGGGVAGLSAAIEAEKLGIKAILFEATFLGGVAYNGGDIVLFNLFEALNQFRDNPNPEEINEYILAKRSIYLEQYHKFFKTRKYVSFVAGKATLKDAHTVVSNGVEYHVSQIILAHGTRTNIPEIPGIHEGMAKGFVKPVRTLLQDDLSPKVVAFYGGGKAAVEFGYYLSTVGVEVYLIVRSQFLKELDDDVREIYFSLISKPNFHFIENATLTSVQAPFITYTKAGQEHTLEVERLILAVGSVPDKEFTEALDFEVSEKGFKVNAFMQTNYDNIYAIGDANELPKYSNLAISEAIIAVKHIRFEKVTFDYDKLVINSVGTIQYSVYGKTEKNLIKDHIPYDKLVYDFKDKNRMLHYFKILIHKQTQEILGIVVIGQDSNRNIIQIMDLLSNKIMYLNSNRNNLFSEGYQLHRLLSNVFVERDQKLIEDNHVVVYQPKVDSKTKKIIGAEMLSRFIVEGKYTSPLPFIEHFENNSTIRYLDIKMLKKSASFLKHLIDKKYVSHEFKLSINVSITTINAFEPKLFFEYVDAYGVSPSQIIIELTERAIDNYEMNFNHLNELKSYGFLLSMDDFSVGHSSLNLLHEVEFDEIKLDKSLVPKDENDFKKVSTFDAILSLVRNTHDSIVIEGVETEEQVHFLDKRNLNVYQGYYFFRPVDASAFELLLENQKTAII